MHLLSVLLYTETLMDGKSVSPGHLFCIRVRSLQSPIFLAILLIGIMMLSESWCFEQKVQEKDGMERERNHSFPWSNFCMMKQDMMVVSFNRVRCAGGLVCAVCGLCCCTSSRQLGYLVGLFVHTEICIALSLLASGC